MRIARDAIRAIINGNPLDKIDPASLSSKLCDPGASFVTLTLRGQLRGCIGTLEAYQPLALDVQEHAVSAATEDYRFPPLSGCELPLIKIEVSRLTPTTRVYYQHPNDLADLIKPGLDGVLIKDGFRRATFLPQVWKKIPNFNDFMTHLCQKMGAQPGLWREKILEVYTYQVEEFKEN